MNQSRKPLGVCCVKNFAKPANNAMHADAPCPSEMPINGVNFERVGSTDSESFAARKIPRITIHSLTQKSENQGILHTWKDRLSAMNLDHYYDTYHVVALYLAYLDHVLGETEAAVTQAP